MRPPQVRYCTWLILLVLAACSHQSVVENPIPETPGPGPSPSPVPTGAPVIVDVTPQDDVGLSADTLVFFPTATNSPTEWRWTFGGGAMPATASVERPVVRLTGDGAFNGTLIASNAAGDSAPFTFQYRVTAASLPPVITAVEPSGAMGPLGEIATFLAAATYNPTSWSWTFEGGVDPVTSTDRAPQVVLTEAGSFTGTVIASNSAAVLSRLPSATRWSPISASRASRPSFPVMRWGRRARSRSSGPSRPSR